MRLKYLTLQSAGVLAGLIMLPTRAQVVIPETYSLPVASADASKPGFVYNVFQNPANQVNDNGRTESALAGTLLDGSGVPLENFIDPSAQGIADAVGTKLGTAPNSLVQFSISGIINLDQAGGSN